MRLMFLSRIDVLRGCISSFWSVVGRVLNTLKVWSTAYQEWYPILGSSFVCLVGPIFLLDEAVSSGSVISWCPFEKTIQ